MVDYKNACIYKICCKDPNIKDVYIGSTCNLIRRRAGHKQSCYNKNDKKKYNYPVYRYIRDHGGWDNWIVLKIKDTPCDNKDELRLKEREEFEKIGATLNSYYPQRSQKEYREENKEKNLEKAKEYYDENKEKILEYHKEYYDKNKEEISEKAKKHREENKEKILEKEKEYREENKEKRKEYYQEKIREKILEKVKCECGSVVCRAGLTRHKKSQKHQNYLKSLEENKISLV